MKIIKKQQNKDIIQNDLKITKTNHLQGANGITLIALVITIIVLLILAGISIGAITGDNGIINQAQNASDSTERSSWEEQIDIAIIDAESKHRNPTWDDIIEELKNKDIIDDESQVDDKTGAITTNEPSYVIEDKLGDYLPFGPGMIADKNETYEDENGDTATIPGGFEILEDADTVDEGLVIQDEQGNQFVWIPVIDGINTMVQCSTAGGSCNVEIDEEDGVFKCTTHDSTDIVGKLYATSTGNNFTGDTPNTAYNANGGLREPAVVTGNSSGTGSNYDNNAETYLSIINEKLGTSYSSSSEFLTDMKADFYNMAKSVEEYGGFYIGRYEISKSDSNTAQSKKNVVALTADNDSTNESQNGNAWYGLYAYGKKYTNPNKPNSVESSMIWGSQYDAMLRWMQSGENKVDVTGNIGDDRNISNTITGGIETDVIRNIYDIYGGRFEWTLEANDTNYRVQRGRQLR